MPRRRSPRGPAAARGAFAAWLAGMPDSSQTVMAGGANAPQRGNAPAPVASVSSAESVAGVHSLRRRAAA